MTDDEARERARRRLEERQARMRGQEGSASPTPSARRGASQSSGHGGMQPSRVSGASPVSGLGATLAGIPAAVAGAARTIGVRRIALAAAVLLLILLAAVAVRSCAGCSAEQEPQPAEAPDQQQEQVARDPIDQAALDALLGDQLAGQLVQAAETDEDAAWVAAHPDVYAVDGDAVQYKLLKLAASEPEARAFVRGFPDAYPADAADAADAAAPGDQAQQGAVPRLYQWDVRWGYTVYSSTTFALTGCCPTALSMVYQGITGKSDLSPWDMGVRASQGGYMTAFDGTDSSFLVNEAESLGLACEPVAVDADSLRAALSAGAVVVCNVGPGDFTDNGHFFVITGVADDGALKVNDPYSAERSNRTWDADQVIGQTKALWAYRAR